MVTLKDFMLGPLVMEDLKRKHAVDLAIRQEMHHPDPYERPDYPVDQVQADAERIRQAWRVGQALRACWRI